MRTQFIQCKDRRTAKRRCPWASNIVKVEMGYFAFESWADWQIYKNQK